MKFYKLEIAPGEDAGEGEDYSEWFTSLAQAKRRRAELIAGNPRLEDHRYGADFEIECHTLRGDLPLKELLLRMLNRSRFSESSVVVPAYLPRRKP